jgi:hypothetical protein
VGYRVIHLIIVIENPLLLDVWDVLDVQAQTLGSGASAGGTLITNNSLLCMNPSLFWGHQSNSILSYDINQVFHFSIAFHVIPLQ